MRGILFTTLADMVEEQHGLAFWHKVLDAADTTDGGAYTSGGNYPTQEFMGIVGLLGGMLGIPSEFLLRAYGEFLLTRLAESFPDFFEPPSLKKFLLGIDTAIHVEVEKIYKDSNLPNFTYEDIAPDKLVMHYRSSRRLCHLAEGLIAGAAANYGVECSILHNRCLLRGDECCTLELQIYD